jgi:hypothetical protein
MKNENWISRIQQSEATPPSGSWEKIQSKRNAKPKLKWSAATAVGIIALSAILWVRQGATSGTTFSKETLIASTPKASQPAKSSIARSLHTQENMQKEKNTPVANLAENEMEIPVVALTPSHNAGFPYNGKVNSSAQTNDVFSDPLSKATNLLPPINEDEILTNLDVNNETTNETALVAFSPDWSQVANLFTPNNDGQNDQYNPFESMPDWLGRGWSVRQDDQIIRTFSATEKWDGNNLGGFEMPAGKYWVEVIYTDQPQSIVLMKKILLLQLVR